MKLLVVLAVLAVAVTAKDLPKPKFGWSTGFVIKGQDAVPHSAPYIVSLSGKAENHNHQCGGTLIAKSWVLTAAHCILGPMPGMGVIAGLHERLNVDNKTQSRVVDWGKLHENYNGTVGPYDIAMLHVSEPFEITRYVQFAALPAVNEIHNGTIHLYGWGQPKAFNFNAAKTLQTVETQIVPYDECKAIMGDSLHPTNLCSDSLKKGISACNGDSGGPLVVEHPGAITEVIGIVSWGSIPCGTFNFPSVYTRISAYLGWIDQVKFVHHFLTQ